MIEQTLLFTVMPRGLTRNPSSLPVSVMLSPRLHGAPTLSAFPDLLAWTERIKAHGLTISFVSGTRRHQANVDVGALHPELWSAIFHRDTRVDEYQFDDYTGRLVVSYPVRATLALVKSVYQIGGLRLALPPGRGREVNPLRPLLDGLQVHWSERLRLELRGELRERPAPAALFPAGGLAPARLGGDGLPDATALPEPGSPAAKQLRRAVAGRFALFHHVPAAPPLVPPPMDEVLDFHKAVTALQAYPSLMRALGLVFDLDLPIDFLPLAGPLDPPALLGVESVMPGWPWSVPPATRPPLMTACRHVEDEEHQTIFVAAPRDPTAPGMLGLLALPAERFGLAQVDVDGAMHKSIILAESMDNVAPPLHPEVFDPTSTLPALRSAGLALIADERATSLLASFQSSRAFNEALESNQPQTSPFFAEDLARGFRIDVWDSHTEAWHSLHRRDSRYTLATHTFRVRDEEGFTHLAVVSAAPGAPPVLASDFYLHEAIARWDGWSLSVPPAGKHLTRSPDPAKAVPPDDPRDPDYDPENPPATPFKMTTHFTAVPASLPSLRFGRSYRVRARVVDLAGNSVSSDDPVTGALPDTFSTPGPEGFAYLRYEPVAAPAIVLRDPRGATDPGSAVDRIVIRTFNSDPSLDGAPADLTAADRHIAPPRTTVELAERLGMLDDAAGKLRGDPAMYRLIADRTGPSSQFRTQRVAGQKEPLPVEPAARITVPYLPDVLSRGAALRDAPGAPAGTLGRAPGSGTGPVDYPPLEDANPRPGSVTLVDFQGAADWTRAEPFRLALAEGSGPPQWDAGHRVLTLCLPKARTAIVPLSSYMTPRDLELMGVWQWLREYLEALVTTTPIEEDQRPGTGADPIAHIVQRAAEGGHWMLTPPHLVTLVHAVQQPLGRPMFVQLTLPHSPELSAQGVLQPDAAPRGPAIPADPITVWRAPGSVDAYLIGGLRIHGASTAKVDIEAEWSDPVDDPGADPAHPQPPSRIQQRAHADEVPLPELTRGFLRTADVPPRHVGYYDPEDDLLAFVIQGDMPDGSTAPADAAPRHHYNDTRHHRVTYRARATSRFRDYFETSASGNELSFTRTSEPVTVHVPASARPDVPRVRYVVPTFGWERQTTTSARRSVRFGGGLRIYLDRPWYSSGDGELLGIVLYAGGLPANRELWKPYVTQWGVDPILDTAPVEAFPPLFPLSRINDRDLTLDEPTPPDPSGARGRVNVAAHDVSYDPQRDLWYADVTLDTGTDAYMPFVRLALARYQPHALADAKLSRVVLADFAQLTPDRALLVTADPHHPRRLRVTITGPVPNGPPPDYSSAPLPPNVPVTSPTRFQITVQGRDPNIPGDLGWHDVDSSVAIVTVDRDERFLNHPYLALWSGTVDLQAAPRSGDLRLMVREYEYVSADYTEIIPGGEALPPRSLPPGRLIYAEAVPLDATASSGG